MTTDSTEKKADEAPEAESGPGPADVPPADVRWGVLGLLATLVIVIAVVLLATFGVGAVRAYWPGNATEQARDDAVAAAEQAMLNVSSIDPQSIDEWDSRLDASFTGDARAQIDQEFGQLRDAVAQAGDVRLVSRLLRSAPAEVDAEAQTARVLVYLSAAREEQGQTAGTVMMSFLVEMVVVDDLWKADNVIPLEGFAFDDVDAEQPPAPAAGEPQSEPEGGN